MEEVIYIMCPILDSGISLDVDADRDGMVEKNNPNKVITQLHGKSCILQEPCQRTEHPYPTEPWHGVTGQLDMGT